MFSKQEQIKNLIFYSSKDLENTEIIKWKRKINIKSINSFSFVIIQPYLLSFNVHEVCKRKKVFVPLLLRKNQFYTIPKERFVRQAATRE